MNNHTQTRNTQSQLEAIVMEVFGGTIAIAGLGLEAMVTLTTGIDAYR